MTRTVGDFSVSRFVEPEQKHKKVKKKDVVHPIFLAYAECIDDPYWSSMLSNAAYGKFPKKFSYQDGNLVFRRKKNISLSLTGDMSVDPYKVVEFFKHHSGITSQADREMTTRELSNTETKEISWGRKRKRIRELMISNYVSFMAKAMNLTQEQKEQLKLIINVGVLFGYLNKDNFETDDKRIIRINGIYFDGTNFILDESLKPKRSKSKPKPTKEVIQPYDFLKKFIAFMSSHIPKAQCEEEGDDTSVEGESVDE